MTSTTLENLPSPSRRTKTEAVGDTVVAEQAWKDVHNALEHQHPIDAIEALGRITTQDIIWRITSVNDIHETFGDKIPAKVDIALRDQIVDDAVELAKRCFNEKDLTILGLGDPRLDESGLSHDVGIREVMLLGRSWDNTGSIQVCELVAKSIEYLSAHDGEIVADALELALSSENRTFHQAFNAIGSKIDRSIDLDWGQAHLRVMARVTLPWMIYS